MLDNEDMESAENSDSPDIPSPATESISENQQIATAIMKAIALVIRRARANSGLTQAEMAERCQISQSVLCRIELGTRDPSYRHLVIACANLGIRLSDVIRKAEDDAFPSAPPWTINPEALIDRPARFETRHVHNPQPRRTRSNDHHIPTASRHGDPEISVEPRDEVPMNIRRRTTCGDPVEEPNGHAIVIDNIDGHELDQTTDTTTLASGT